MAQNDQADRLPDNDADVRMLNKRKDTTSRRMRKEMEDAD
jgi:hypothetical protein